MHPYIQNTEFASRNLLNMIHQMKEDLQGLQNWARSVKFLREIFMETQYSEERAMHGFQQLMKERDKREQFKESYRQHRIQYLSKHSAIAVVSGAVLQIATQGIAVKYGHVTSCHRDARDVRSIPIQRIIWAGRNQSMHYDTGDYFDETFSCFDQLAGEYGPKFGVGQGRGKDANLAFEIIKILEWNNYEQYEKDMTALLG